MPSSNHDALVARVSLFGAALSRDEVQDIQRARVLSAMVETSSELGYAGAVVAPVVARAGVSRRTFYELFDGRDDCFLAAFEWAVEQAREAVARSSASKRSWREQVRHALAELLRFLDAEPSLARVLVIEALAAGKPVLECRARALGELTAALARSAPASRASGGMSQLTAEGIVGGAFSVIHARLLQPQRTPLADLYGQLMALVVLPYLGARAARQEQVRAVPPPPAAGDGRQPFRARGRLLERLDMRLTYRTVRCLLFIGENPSASNKTIAHGAEISDEGQASKLLGRLSRLQLIANSGPSGPGRPNQWTLTPQGEQLLAAINAHPESLAQHG
jgi:AcrR family transcriptional regulator/DNA-binding MarR family transcriptional regulator